MPKVTEFTYYHSPFIRDVKSFCYVKIYRNEFLNNDVVVLVEPQNNPGRNVTNACADIATNLLMEADLYPETTIWIEYYEESLNKALGFNRLPEIYAAIEFDWVDGVADNPRWIRISREQFELLVDDPEA